MTTWTPILPQDTEWRGLNPEHYVTTGYVADGYFGVSYSTSATVIWSAVTKQS